MGSRFVAGHAAAMAVAIAKTQEASEIADRRKHMDLAAEAMRGGFDAWAETNRKQRRAATRDKREFRLKGLRP